MELSPFQKNTTTLRWPDEQAGEFELTLEWLLLGERWECVGLAFGFAEGAVPRPVRTADLRQLRVPAEVERHFELLRDKLAHAAQEELAQPQEAATCQLEYRRRLLRSRRRKEALRAKGPKMPGRPALPLAELARVAEIYIAAFKVHEPPRRAVAAELEISLTAAAKRIASCREIGLLGPAERGKASVGPLIGRGTADSLASMIAIKTTMAARSAKEAGKETRVGSEGSRGAGQRS
jgi:hypothetical protein